MEKVHKCSSALPSLPTLHWSLWPHGLPALRAHMQRHANTFNAEVFYPHNALRLQGGPSGGGKPPADLVLALPAAAGPLL